jgi:3-phenylpropionate/cinnamic acid dioxygenase small subunit
MNSVAMRSTCDELHARYAQALDARDMKRWLACFATDGSYLCQSRENHERGLPIGYMWDDRYARLQDRVKTVEEVWKGTAEEYQPRHLVQTLSVSRDDADHLQACSNFVVFSTTHRGDSQVLATGEYLDRIRIAKGTALLVARRAILDQITVPRYLVYPI